MPNPKSPIAALNERLQKECVLRNLQSLHLGERLRRTQTGVWVCTLTWPVPTQNCPDGIGSGSTVQQAKTAAASDLLQKVPPRSLDRDDSQAVFEVLLDNFDHVYVHGRSQDWVSKDKLWCFNIYVDNSPRPYASSNYGFRKVALKEAFQNACDRLMHPNLWQEVEPFVPSPPPSDMLIEKGGIYPMPDPLEDIEILVEWMHSRVGELHAEISTSGPDLTNHWRASIFGIDKTAALGTSTDPAAYHVVNKEAVSNALRVVSLENGHFF